MNRTASPICPHCGEERELWPLLEGAGYRALCPHCDLDEAATDLEAYRQELERALLGEALPSGDADRAPAIPPPGPIPPSSADTSSQQALSLRRCPHCDATVKPEAALCPWCGRSLTEPASS